jgi:F0F1-type ATP synthase assembly protein I
MSSEPPKPETSADQASNVAKYSGIAFTMLAIIGLSTWAGTWLDAHFHTKTPWYTVGLMLLGLFVALYQVIRSLTK